MSAKAAKVLGVDNPRSSSRRTKQGKSRAIFQFSTSSDSLLPVADDDDDEDIVMVGAGDAEPNPERLDRRRSKVRLSHLEPSIYILTVR